MLSKIRKVLLSILLFISLVGNIQLSYAQADEKQWLHAQINALRAQLGLHGYVWNNQLAAAAQQQSDYMASTGHVSHQQSNGSTPTDRARANGYTGSWVIENIYGGMMATSNDAWAFWTTSSVHYAGLVNANTNEIGIGVASSSLGQYYTLVFGRGTVQSEAPPPAAPADPNQEAPPPSQGQSVPAAPAPTQRPIRPSATFTPSPTIPTFTPTVTWTFTPSWTPTASPSAPPPTSTAIILPTAAPITAVAQVMVTPAQVVSIQSPSTAGISRRQESVSKSDSSNIRDLLPYLLVGQVILIGIGVFSLFIRRKT